MHTTGESDERLPFPYEYVGGGHYRDSRVPKGTPADTLHGDQIVVAMHDLYAAELRMLRESVAENAERTGFYRVKPIRGAVQSNICK